VNDETPTCWLRTFGSGDCYGRLVRAHLIPQQTLKKEISYVCPQILWDPRVWVWACGGVMGQGSHHGMFDAHRIIVPYVDLPVGLLEFAEEHGLLWYLEKHYPTMSEQGVG
jgi:hypothetical protein